jgi:5-methylcytosine-specific restriction protein A
MPRALEEWVGKTPDTKIPDRIKDRVWDDCGSRCHRCTRLHRGEPGWIIEHLKALINGGENRQSNLCLSCPWCKTEKDAEDVAEKSASYAVRKKHRGIAQPKRPMPGSKASGLRKRMDGTVERRR